MGGGGETKNKILGPKDYPDLEGRWSPSQRGGSQGSSVFTLVPSSFALSLASSFQFLPLVVVQSLCPTL